MRKSDLYREQRKADLITTNKLLVERMEQDQCKVTKSCSDYLFTIIKDFKKEQLKLEDETEIKVKQIIKSK